MHAKIHYSFITINIGLKDYFYFIIFVIFYFSASNQAGNKTYRSEILIKSLKIKL